jgi:hypothetical protein
LSKGSNVTFHNVDHDVACECVDCVTEYLEFVDRIVPDEWSKARLRGDIEEWLRWYEPLPVEPRSRASLRDQLVDTEGLVKLPVLEPLIGGVLYRHSLTWLQGRSGDGKSFVAIDMAGCVGTGEPWHGHKVKQGLVLYLVAEGACGVELRVRAWEHAMRRPMTGLQWLPAPVQVGSPDWDELDDVVRGFAALADRGEHAGPCHGRDGRELGEGHGCPHGRAGAVS